MPINDGEVGRLGQYRKLDSARNSAIWPEATLEQLSNNRPVFDYRESRAMVG